MGDHHLLSLFTTILNLSVNLILGQLMILILDLTKEIGETLLQFTKRTYSALTSTELMVRMYTHANNNSGLHR